MQMNKRIICDFDDTIAVTLNRDWDNAIPNVELIDKLNHLQLEGWVVDIYTARGSLSCKTREEADNKYRTQIETWLNNHNVKYNSLSFDKPLGHYYIDDKGISPNDFVEMKIENLNGLSGSEIYTDGKEVHKRDPNTQKVIEWFNSVRSLGISVPEVTRVIGDTMSMKYIEHDENFFASNPNTAMGIIFDALNKLVTKEDTSNQTYADYINRIQGHIDLVQYVVHKSTFEYVLKNANMYQLPSTFHHGDFGIKNLLFTKNNDLVLIDPIIGTFGSYVLDLAKFCASLLLHGYTTKDEEYKLAVSAALWYCEDVSQLQFTYLIQTELIRVYKYHPDKNFIFSCVVDVIGTEKYDNEDF